MRWTQDLNLSPDTVSWSDVHKCNYFATPERKLRFFYIKLNLRAIDTNIVLFGIEIKTTDKCTFVILNVKVTRMFIFYLFLQKNFDILGKII